MARREFYTSESVAEGHPDKIADQISDAVLDAILADDPYGRVACETMVTTGMAVVVGEITTDCYVDIPQIVRQTIKDIGYTNSDFGFDYHTCAVLTSINEQSPDIDQGVSEGKGLHAEQGAGDQGIMVGYATKETEEFMPMPISLAHKLVKKLGELRRENVLKYLRPDGKSQVTVEYLDGKPARIDTVVLSAQHNPDISHKRLQSDLTEHVIEEVIPEEYLDKDTIYHINPTGRFVVGGPQGDSGITGRKIVVDTYGGRERHGGGCFSGKDPTKVDRSASYAARYIAKNIVAADLAEKCEVQLAYAIGVAEPVSITLDTFGTAIIPEEKIIELVREHFPLKPKEIINSLRLRRPIYKKTAVYGHFGRDHDDFTWEKVNKANALKKAAGI